MKDLKNNKHLYCKRESASQYTGTKCTQKNVAAQIRLERKYLARRIFKMVKNLSEENLINFFKTEFINNGYFQCNNEHDKPMDIGPVIIVELVNKYENQNNANQGTRRRRRHH
ncbi:MAG: hypothetical protein WC780_05350 [Lentimicrobiaceae bacterium]|jgi:hypothetical protein